MLASVATLAQALCLAYASGISLYATIALLGIAERWGWVTGLPSPLSAVGSPWIVGLAFVLTVVEFVATLVPGLASLWDGVHSFIRPPAAAALAILLTWHGDPALVLTAGLLGGTLGLATHATKLGVRIAVDSSPEPVTNGVANVGELTTVALVMAFVWQHPFVTLGAAIVVLIGAALLVRSLWRLVRRAVVGEDGAVG